MIKRDKYDYYIEKIQECVESYKRKGRINYHQQLILSNSNVINYRFVEKYIPHLLGVNTEFFKNERLVRSTSSFAILEEFLANSYSIFNKLAVNGFIDEKKIFSPYIDQKLSIFDDNIQFNFFEIKCIVEIDKEKTYQNEYSEEMMAADYLIVTNNKEDGYNILALHREENDNFSPISSLHYTKDNAELFTKYFYKQNCLIPYMGRLITIDSSKPPRSFYYSLEQQKNNLVFLKKMREKYKMSICVERNYDLFMSKCLEYDKQNETIKNLLKNIINCVLNDTKINIEDIAINENLLALFKTFAEAYNSTLYLKNPLTDEEIEIRKDNENIQEELTNLILEKEKLEKEKRDLQKKEEQLSQKYDSLQNDYLSLQNALISIKATLNKLDTKELKLETKM